MKKFSSFALAIVMIFFASNGSWAQVSIGGQGSNATINCPATPTFTAPTASSGCGGTTVFTLGDITGGNNCSNFRTRIWYATDACNNTSNTVSQTITTVDFTAPTIGGQGSNATIVCPATPTFTAPTASDACGGASVLLLSTIITGNSCSGTIGRTWVAVDACGNSSNTVSQVITIEDFPALTIGGQGNNATINCPATPTFTAPTASSGCGGITVFTLGDITGGNNCSKYRTRIWYATDACNNTSNTVSQTITTVDFTAPTIGGQGSNATIVCPASPTFTAPTASDACGGVTVRVLTTIISGKPCSGTIRRTWDAVDACGNSSNTVSQTITLVSRRFRDLYTISGEFPSITAAIQQINLPEATDTKFKASVFPNPGYHSFTLYLTSNNFVDKVSLQVLDMGGRVIETRTVNTNSKIKFGDGYRPGTYFVRIIRGSEHKEIKLIKLSE